METDLDTANRKQLLALITQLERMILALRADLEALRAELEALRTENAALRQQLLQTLPKEEEEHEESEAPTASPNPATERRPRSARKKRAQGYGRKRLQATRRVVHALDTCSHCGCGLRGGSVKRTREVLHIPIAPVEVIEHVFIERRCPLCGQRQTPGAEALADEVMGQHRVSRQTMALIATWREEGRLPVRVIQWALQTFWHLELSAGEIVAILHTVAACGREQVAQLRTQLRASPVVQGDETTWRENGQNGYFWSFSTPQVSYLEYRHSRSGQMVEDVLGTHFYGVLGSDFYAAYNRHQGQHQRCWAHLLRDIHTLKLLYPHQEQLQTWAKAIHALYLEACLERDKHRDGPWIARYHAQQEFERRILAECQPFHDQDVPQRTLCRRIERFVKELFTFVVDPRVSPDNNAAERAVRPLAVARKISGGTRSARGSETKGILASLFGTWRLQGLNPFPACCRLLASPQL
jgi:transposase